MEMLEGFGEPDGHDFVLRNWSYFDLQKDVDYKAKRAGIKVVKIDPYHTSQTCSECGHFEPGQRKSQSEFVCAKCGAKIHADYNAAVNIARSDKVVKSKEECEYFKQHARDNERSDAGATVRGTMTSAQGLPVAAISMAVRSTVAIPASRFIGVADRFRTRRAAWIWSISAAPCLCRAGFMEPGANETQEIGQGSGLLLAGLSYVLVSA